MMRWIQSSLYNRTASVRPNVVYLVMKGQTDLPRKVENVNNQAVKSHILRKRGQSRLLEEISVLLLMTTHSRPQGTKNSFPLKKIMSWHMTVIWQFINRS
ncbi:hypothetical protein BsWGS_08241 [Bradybaena similaris]